MKTITITVRDWVHDPFSFASYRAGSAERTLLERHGKQVQEVAHQAEQTALKDLTFAGGTFFYDDRGELICVIRKHDAEDKPCPRGAPKALVTAIDTLLDAFVFPMEITIRHLESLRYFDVQYRYWLKPDRSDYGGTLAYDPRGWLWPHDLEPSIPAPAWKLLPAY